jgi:hypothetical protein
MKLLLHAGPGDRDADAVQVGDDREQAEQQEIEVASVQKW